MFLVLLFIIFLNVYIAPFTKVEESFNIQAIHDLINMKLNYSNFDHINFPGVVPRTFTVPVFISFLSVPLVYLNAIFDVPKSYQQYIVRGVIAFLSFLGHYFYASAIRKCCGKTTAFYYIIITLSQFHINFYASRSLPNTFALIVALFSISFYMTRKYICFVVASGIVVMLIRSELSILFGIMFLPILINKGLQIWKICIAIIVTAVIILAVSIPIDSYFWRRLVWPEFEVLWFNTILNRSSEWGTHPFLWYFYSALPRCLMTSTVLVVGNFVLNRNSKTREMSIFALLFTLIYSFLPHKEVRFIIYVIPILNGAAAHFWQSIYEKSQKSFLFKTIQKMLWLLVVVNVVSTSFLMMVSHHNYPGGEAISILNSKEGLSSKDLHVHICNLAAQTGMTRFLEVHRHWIYNKTEHIEGNADAMSLFSHVILESEHVHNFLSMMSSEKSLEYSVLFQVSSFGGLSRQWPFYKLIPTLSVLERT